VAVRVLQVLHRITGTVAVEVQQSFRLLPMSHLCHRQRLSRSVLAVPVLLTQ
jgi:hypothetical protein